MQGFYWNTTPGGIWWDSLARLAPRLASAGFSAIWFPPPTKGAAGALSMGYDIYDQYDFGDYNQKGSVETRFGSRAELLSAISIYHDNGMQVFADAVMGHMNGGDQKVPYECKPYPSYPDSGYLVFNYATGSGRFKKNASHFSPNLQTCDVNPPYHGPSDPIFKFGEILAHAQSKVEDSLIVWGRFLRNNLGFDGFRIDEVKSIDPIFVGPWIQQADSNGYAVAEYYGSTSEIQTWLHYCNDVFGGHASMFDFPLRFSLQDMCNNTSGTYDMNNLDYAGLVNAGTSGYNVATFVENHDLDRVGWDGAVDNGHNPIIYNKDMAYAYTIFSEGRPCVWYRDYFVYGLSGRIDTLIWIRQNFLYGTTTKRGGLSPYYVGALISQDDQSKDIYVARRDGGNGHPAAYLVMNDNPNEWRGVWVNTSYPNQVFRDFTGKAMDKTAAGDGRVDLWAPPRGYAIYVPDTTMHINHPPYIVQIPHLTAYTNTFFQYQTAAGDPNNDSLAFSLSGNPSWLTISGSGVLGGMPNIEDLTPSTVTVTVADQDGDSASTTFTLGIVTHPLMDGSFEGTGIWGEPVAVGDTLGWDGTRASGLYVTLDSTYFYFGAAVRARQWMTWAFLINTKVGGGSTDSWGRSIVYNHPSLPDYIARGNFGNYAEFHTWNGGSWSGVGTPLSTGEFGENITTDSLQDGWVEVRIPRTSIGDPSLVQVQFFITGNQNSEATFDACPTDQNTTVWSGVTTHLHYYADRGAKTLTKWNLQFPQSAMIAVGNSATIYGRTFGLGVTDSTGPGPGVQAWIGYDSSVTNPSTWSTWQPAGYNIDVGYFDEYKAAIGASLLPGVYHYATRFQYNGGNYLYGGYSQTGGGMWDSIHNISGTLTVVGPPAPVSLTAPANNAEHQPSTILLSWAPINYTQAYRLQVALDSGFTSIVYDDSSISTSSRPVGSLTNNTSYFWRVRAKNIAGTGPYSAFWRFSVSQTTAKYLVHTAWNMISLPMNVFEHRKVFLFPSATSKAFEYDPSAGYVIRDTLEVGKGFWLKFGAPESVAITGYALTAETVAVHPGWNLIGSLSTSVSTGSIAQNPPGLVLSPYFYYLGGYHTTTSLDPSRAHWVKCSSVGTLALSSGASPKVADPGGEISRAGLVSIRCGSHDQTELYVAESDAPAGGVSFEAPPLPPDGVVDIRFSSGKIFEQINRTEIREFPLKMSGIKYPVSLSYRPNGQLCNISVWADGREILPGPEGEIILRQPAGNTAIRAQGSASIPKAFSLFQNFPNPFNPSTRISYALPVAAHVQLTIFNVLGEKVATLVDEIQQAGYTTASWNAVGEATGLYFYRLDATVGAEKRFSQVRKLMVLK